MAIFEPVELEGTTVSRASVHNLSIMEELELGIGDTIEVYKANMIIPQIAENLTRSGMAPVPEVCPVCQGKTQVQQVANAKALYCTNPQCQAKHVKSFTLLTSRDAFNIDGLSEATLEKFISRGFIREFADIFHLDRFASDIKEMEGFGEKSCQNLLDSIEKARKTTLPKVIYSLGIANIGLANAKTICREFNNDEEKLLNATKEELDAIGGIGEVIAQSYIDYFANQERREQFLRLLAELQIQKEETNEEEQTWKGMNFVVTGSLVHFANRNELKEQIEKKGGKVTGSVTKKTNYLINNDTASSSSKNKKARELKIPIISEETFLEMLKGD